MERERIYPSDFSSVLSLSRTFARALNGSVGLSITDFRVLSCIVSSGGKRNADIAAMLDLSRSAVSMSTRNLRESRLVSRRTEIDPDPTATLSGRMAFDVGRDAMSKALADSMPALKLGEKEVLDYCMSMVADHLGAPMLSAGGIDTIVLYVEANTRVKQLIKRCCAPHGMTANEFVTMCAIISSGGTAHPMDLARLTRLASPVVTKCCSALSDIGYIEVSSEEHDGRMKSATATDVGARAFHAAFDAFWAELHARIRPFRNEEIDFFHAICDRLQTR